MKKLQELRKKQGLNQQQLAQKLALSTSAIGMYEQGRREPSHDILLKMANYFGVSTDYLLDHAKTVQNPSHERVGQADSDSLTNAVLAHLMEQNALMFHAGNLDQQDYEKITLAIRQAVELALARQSEE